jgi:hypothetical protein
VASRRKSADMKVEECGWCMEERMRNKEYRVMKAAGNTLLIIDRVMHAWYLVDKSSRAILDYGRTGDTRGLTMYLDARKER